MKRHPLILDSLWVALSCGLSFALTKFFELPFIVNWDQLNIVDRQLLENSPVQSLFCLHSQVPGLNSFLAIVVSLADLTGMPDNSVAHGGFLLLGLLGAIAVCRVLGELTQSVVFARSCTLLMVIAPSYLKQSTMVDYTFLVFNLFAFFAWSLTFYLQRKSIPLLCLTLMFLWIIVLTRQLYDPYWAVLTTTLILLAAYVAPTSADRPFSAKKSLSIAAMFLPLFMSWPIKNEIVYGKFVNVSLSGFNLLWRLPIVDEINPYVGGYLLAGMVPSEIEAKRATYSPFCQDAQVITETAARPTGRTFNHFIFLETYPALVRTGMVWRFTHLRDWANLTLAQYFMIMRPPFIFPYGLQVWGPANNYFIRYGSLIQAIFYPDLRPIAERLFPHLSFYADASIRGTQVPFTLFGFLWFPVIMLLTLAPARRLVSRNRKTLTSHELALVIFAFIISTNVFLPALTDGFEGNRMRFETASLFWVITCTLFMRGCVLLAHSARRFHTQRGSVHLSPRL